MARTTADPAPRRLTGPRVFAAGVVLLALLAADVVVLREFFTSRYPGANDFYARWRPIRAWLFEGVGPYSAEASLLAQIGTYGRPALPAEDKMLFSYPFHSVVFFIGPALIQDYSWASAIWLTILQPVILGLLALSFVWARWRPPPWLFGLSMLFGLLWYHTTRTFILGQFAAINAVIILAALLAARAGREALAGSMLALATAKPQMSFLIVPAVLVWALASRRARLLTGFALTMAVLLGIAFALRPAWLFEWREQLGVYVDNSLNRPPVSFIAEWLWPAGAWPVLQLGLTTLLLLVWGWQGWLFLRRGGHSWEWMAGLTLVTTCLIAPRTATTDYLMMTPVLFGLFGEMQSRWAGRGQVLIAVSQIILFAGLWALFIGTLAGDQEHSIMYLPWPILMWLGLFWLRPVTATPAPNA